MAKVNNEQSNLDKMRAHQAKRGSAGLKSDIIKEVELGVEEAMGNKIFDFRLTKCLNARASGSSEAISSVEKLLVPQEENPCILSDADNQLLLSCVFREKVNLNCISFRADQPPTKAQCGDDDPEEFQPPLNVHIYVNQEGLDFNDTDDYPALEKKELEWDDDKTTNKITLAGPKFQRAQSLQIFVVDAKEDAQFTFLNHVSITGTIAPDYHV